jgi:hypothetical protein
VAERNNQGDAVVDDLVARMERLEAENQRLRALIEAQPTPDGGTHEPTPVVSRRHLLSRAGTMVAAGAAAAAVGGVVSAQPAAGQDFTCSAGRPSGVPEQADRVEGDSCGASGFELLVPPAVVVQAQVV